MRCSYVNKPELWLVVQMTDAGQLSRARVAGATRGSGILPDILPDLSRLQNHCSSNQTVERTDECKWEHSVEQVIVLIGIAKPATREFGYPSLKEQELWIVHSCKSFHFCIGVLLTEKGNCLYLAPFPLHLVSLNPGSSPPAFPVYSRDNTVLLVFPAFHMQAENRYADSCIITT